LGRGGRTVDTPLIGKLIGATRGPERFAEVQALGAVLFHHFLELTVADRIRHVPADGPQDDGPFKMTTLELDHRLLTR
jgi:hypothetical protein